MKKFLLFFVALALVAAVILPVMADASYRNESNSQSENVSHSDVPEDLSVSFLENQLSYAQYADAKIITIPDGLERSESILPEWETLESIDRQDDAASEKTLILAEFVVKRIIEEAVIFDDKLGVPFEIIYLNAERVIPELAMLDSLPDSSAALLELYEKYASFLETYDYEALAKRVLKGQNDSENYPWRYEDPEGYTIWNTPDAIEGLLAYSSYFDKLNDEQQLRFSNAFCTIHNVISDAKTAIFGHDESVLFIDRGGATLLKDNTITYDNTAWS